MPDLRSELPAQFTFSQSSLQDYFDCPRRFQLRYLERLAWPAVESEPVMENERRQQEGQLFHRMIQQHLIGLPEEKLGQLANTPDLQRWWENYLHALDLQDLKGYASLNTELTLATPIGGSRLMAKYDLVAVQPGKARIYDWKTYHKRPRDEWMAARLQTRVYRALLVQAGATLNAPPGEKAGTPFQPEQIEMVYWYAEFPSEPARFPYDAAQYRRDLDALTGLVNEIANHRHFPLTADEKKCVYCPYRSYCNRGTKAGEAEDVDAGPLDNDINFEQIQEIAF